MSFPSMLVRYLPIDKMFYNVVFFIENVLPLCI